jgi:hypothetical protein
VGLMGNPSDGFYGTWAFFYCTRVDIYTNSIICM